MARAKELLCPNCNAPLPVVTMQTKTECVYCGRPLILEPAQRPPPPVPYPPPPGPNPHTGVPRPRTSSKAPLIITLVILVAAFGMAMAIFMFINSTVRKSRDTSREVAEQIEAEMRRAVDQQTKAMEKAFDIPELERLQATAEEARAQAEAARETAAARREAASRNTKRSAKRPAKAKPKPLPESVDDALVERALAKLDVSHCPGPGFIVYTMRADSSGKLRTVSQGPMRVSGGTFGCIGKVVDEAKKTVTFPKSKNGSGPVKRRLEAPDTAAP